MSLESWIGNKEKGRDIEIDEELRKKKKKIILKRRKELGFIIEDLEKWLRKERWKIGEEGGEGMDGCKDIVGREIFKDIERGKENDGGGDILEDVMNGENENKEIGKMKIEKIDGVNEVKKRNVDINKKKVGIKGKRNLKWKERIGGRKGNINIVIGLKKGEKEVKKKRMIVKKK